MNTAKRTYHHGDLRNALLMTALDTLVTEGLDKVTLRNIAKKTGVSQAAPYAHFKDKSALLVEVAAVGFSKLKYALSSELKECESTEEYRYVLSNMGVAYVEFAIENKALFRLMFGDVIAEFPKSESYSIEANAAFGCMEGAVQKISGVDFASDSAWSIVHGLASLIVDNRIQVEGDLKTYIREVTKFLDI
ncbi:hypothetical protein A9Q83_01170 [Alphaproteobacteria bacterium 46_93_T64]|nr:hypothetical protein A9Q83_01170 [Alphaproteobacteria bacterium 46_93_T64]